MAIRTRFAPSPTGYLHIGGVRTALFNWLLVKRHGGQFILRIDDTDAERNRPEALQPILDGFRWLGILWDEGPEVGGPCEPYYQSQRLERYKAAAMKLVETGHAYPCTASKEELEADRKKAAVAKQSYVHRGKLRDIAPAEALKILSETPCPIRLKVTPGQTLTIQDSIRGEVSWQTDTIGDPVILRANGIALYNFATVVDDIDFKITHIVRAAEHLANTNTQALVYHAMGAPLPIFAHVPVVNEPNSTKKLSKRDMKKFITPDIRASLKNLGYIDEEIDVKDDLNPVTVNFYKEMGYLPAAIINYLGRLGWSLDDKSEVILLEEMVNHFSLDRVKDSPASFGPDKLYWLNGEYMKKLPIEEKVAGVLPYLVKAKLLTEPVGEAAKNQVKQVVEACGDRIKLFSDILTYGAFFFRDPVFDEGVFAKRVKKEGIPPLLTEFAGVLKALPTFDNTSIDHALHQFCESKAIKIGDMNHALRVATTGVAIGPGLFDCLSILGREETLKRMEAALKRAV